MTQGSEGENGRLWDIWSVAHGQESKSTSTRVRVKTLDKCFKSNQQNDTTVYKKAREFVKVWIPFLKLLSHFIVLHTFFIRKKNTLYATNNVKI